MVVGLRRSIPSPWEDIDEYSAHPAQRKAGSVGDAIC